MCIICVICGYFITFAPFLIKRTDYEDISTRFTDVYSVDLSKARPLSFKDLDEEKY